MVANTGRMGVLIVIIGTLLSTSGEVSTSGAALPSLSSYEAQILVYISPDAHEIRESGRDVDLYPVTSEALNSEEYYFYDVRDPESADVGSDLVGHYAVNKYSADLVNAVTQEQIDSVEVNRIEDILRKAHQMHEAQIKKYRGRNLNRDAKLP